MTFLPIVQRELRVAARRKATYWSRNIVALAAFLIFALVIVLFESRQFGGVTPGPILFGIFSWLSFAFVCSAGVFLTSDTLSEEKREGTLGLLFLTDLRGYDVVIGKLISNSLSATYGLMAAFPVLGVSFLLGGVTGGEFWRLILVLFNTLFFSLTAGILISALSRDPHRAMNGTLALCALFILLFPAVDWARAGWEKAGFEPLFSLASPQFAFTQFQNIRLRDFWATLCITHFLAWGFLGAACIVAPRQWQDSATAKENAAHGAFQRLQFGVSKKRAAFRKRWVEANPMRWLTARDFLPARTQWLALTLGAAVFAAFSFTARDASTLVGLGQGTAGFLTLLMNIWLASHACRFFVEANRSGTMELLLVTPVSPKQIISAQLWAVRRAFFWPAVILVSCTIVVGIAQMNESLASMRKSNPAAPNLAYLTYFWIADMLGSAATFLTSLLAMAWFGMWMGLQSKKVNVAVIKTLVWVQVVPFIVLTFANIAFWTFIGAALGSPWMGGLTQITMAAFGVGADVAFILISRRKLLHRFRDMVTQLPKTRSSVVADVSPAVEPGISPGGSTSVST